MHLARLSLPSLLSALPSGLSVCTLEHPLSVAEHVRTCRLLWRVAPSLRCCPVLSSRSDVSLSELPLRSLLFGFAEPREVRLR